MQIKNHNSVLLTSVLLVGLLLISTTALYADDTRAPLGACCMGMDTQDQCLYLEEDECIMFEGFWLGEDSNCDDCGTEDYGACCIKLNDNITCLMTTPEICATQLGWTVFRGYDTDCQEGGCIPDCGDLNFDGGVNILDVLYSISLIYKCGPRPFMEETADVDGNGYISILDALYLIVAIYRDGPDPICPGLQPTRCDYQLITTTRDCE